MGRFFRELFSWFIYLAVAIVIGLVLNNTVIASAVVISSSMENTIMTDSRVMGLRVSYVFNDPERFDIILFEPPDGYNKMPYVKRIIGLPGEHLEIIAGKVFINGSTTPLDDSFIMEPARGDFGPFDIPPYSFFVMGDNRNRSSDSRHWENAFVPQESIIGRLYFEFFPSPRFFR